MPVGGREKDTPGPPARRERPGDLPEAVATTGEETR